MSLSRVVRVIYALTYTRHMHAIFVDVIHLVAIFRRFLLLAYLKNMFCLFASGFAEQRTRVGRSISM